MTKERNIISTEFKESVMSAHPSFKPFNFLEWLEKHKHEMKPPVTNKLLHNDAGMVIMALGGGNTRADFHDDPV